LTAENVVKGINTVGFLGKKKEASVVQDAAFESHYNLLFRVLPSGFRSGIVKRYGLVTMVTHRKKNKKNGWCTTSRGL
jgi:hypothetical protein